MPLRAPSSRIRCICIFVSSFDDGLDEDDDVLPPPPLMLLLILRMFSAVEFLTVFFVVFINYLRGPRKELYSSSDMSKPGRRRGNEGPSNSGFNIGRCG